MEEIDIKQFIFSIEPCFSWCYIVYLKSLLRGAMFRILKHTLTYLWILQYRNT